MSDRLDDDALLLILQELAAPSPIYWTYLTRKRALSNLCLASHRLRRLAQPLLWRQVWVVKQSQADALRSSSAASSLGQCTKWYTVGKRECGNSLPDAVEMADLMPNVEKLLLWGLETPGNLARIASFTNLRHLSLVDSELGGFSMLVMAPLLEELDLHGGFISYPGAAEWLKPRYLPALRILSVVVNDEEADLVGRFELSQILGPAMLAQLDVIHTVQEHVELRSDLARGTAPAVLISDPEPEEDEDDDASLPRHSIFPISTWAKVPVVAIRLRRITAQVEDSLSSPVAGGPRVVVLPRWVLSLSTRNQDVGDAVQRLEEAYGDAVRIIWSGDEGLSLAFGGVSREFVQYAREVKAARLQQEAEAQQVARS
ncbi:hypothetical protein JCM9279_005014 [Rhodotorula babjevae]